MDGAVPRGERWRDGGALAARWVDPGAARPVRVAIVDDYAVVIAGVARFLADIGAVIDGFTWVVCRVTAVGVALSFTPLRRLEGAGVVVGAVALRPVGNDVLRMLKDAGVVCEPHEMVDERLWYVVDRRNLE